MQPPHGSPHIPPGPPHGINPSPGYPPQIPPVAPTYDRPPGVWSPWATAGLSVAIFIVYAVLQTVFFLIAGISVMNDLHPDGYSMMAQLQDPESEFMGLQNHGMVMAAVTIGGGLLGIIVVWLFIKMKDGSNWRKYLHLKKPTLKEVLFWTGIYALYFFGTEFLATDSEELQSDFMTGMAETGNLWLLLLGVGIIGPIFEEIFFRGFLFKGLQHSKLGGAGAIAVTSFFFVIIHLQYSWQILLMLFPIAFILGAERWRTNSIVIPIYLHILNNTVSTIVTWYLVNSAV